jgi:hypothetical protein
MRCRIFREKHLNGLTRLDSSCTIRSISVMQLRFSNLIDCLSFVRGKRSFRGLNHGKEKIFEGYF